MVSRVPTAKPSAASKSMNRKLTAVREAKQDEFYTRYVDIQKEVEAYLEFGGALTADRTETGATSAGVRL